MSTENHIQRAISQTNSTLVASLQPLTIGILGFICCTIGRKIWVRDIEYIPTKNLWIFMEQVMVWVIYNVLSTSAGYTLLTVSGCLTPEAYGVNIHIYADCHQAGEFCICSA
jgi:hypothetical protein